MNQDAMGFHCVHCNVSFPFQSKYDRHLESMKHKQFLMAMEEMNNEVTCTCTSDTSSASSDIDSMVSIF